MSFIGIIIFLVVGLIAGFIARAVVPGRQSMGIIATLILGLVGSLVGGFLGALIFHHDIQDGLFQASGIIGSIIGAIIVLLIYVAITGRRRA